MPFIKPTVGRVVHFRQMTPGAFPGSEGTCAAIVAYVHSDRLVNLTVLDANGNTHSRTSITLVQPEDEPSAFAHCLWMDFQIGQASKLAETLDCYRVEIDALRDRATALEATAHEAGPGPYPLKK